jgi:hypothetical protein
VVKQFHVEYRLVETEDARHGFAAHDDPIYATLQSQERQGS